MPPSKLAHVVYMTRRYEQMLDWYQKVFQATVQYQNPAFAFLTYDDEHHRFAFANMSVLTPDNMDTDSIAKVGVNHVGYTYSSIAELLETYERLKHLDITPLLASASRAYAVDLLPRSRRQSNGVSG